MAEKSVTLAEAFAKEKSESLSKTTDQNDNLDNLSAAELTREVRKLREELKNKNQISNQLNVPSNASLLIPAPTTPDGPPIQVHATHDRRPSRVPTGRSMAGAASTAMMSEMGSSTHNLMQADMRERLDLLGERVQQLIQATTLEDVVFFHELDASGWTQGPRMGSSGLEMSGFGASRQTNKAIDLLAQGDGFATASGLAGGGMSTLAVVENVINAQQNRITELENRLQLFEHKFDGDDADSVYSSPSRRVQINNTGENSEMEPRRSELKAIRKDLQFALEEQHHAWHKAIKTMSALEKYSQDRLRLLQHLRDKAGLNRMTSIDTVVTIPESHVD